MSEITEQLPFVAIQPLASLAEYGQVAQYTQQLNQRFLAINTQIQRLTQGLYAKGDTAPTFTVSGGGATDIPDYSITEVKLATGAVVGRVLLDGIITELKIANAAITNAKIAVAAIQTVNLDDAAVSTSKLAVGAVTTDILAANSVTSVKVLAGAIQTGHIAAGAVVTDSLGALVVTTAKLAALAVTADKIAANTITAAQIAANTITAAQVASNTLTTANMNFTVVGTTNIVATINSSSEGITITGSRLTINSATTFASGYDPSTKITTGSAAADVNSGTTTINGGKITTNSITTAQVNFTVVSTTNVIATINASSEGITIAAARISISGSTTFASGYDPTGKIATGGAASDVNNGTTTINGGKITTNTITTSQLNFTVVGVGNIVSTINGSTEGITIAASKITISGSTTFTSGYDPTGKIASGGAAADVNANSTTINGGKITANSVTATQLNVSQLSAITANLGTITAGSITLDTSGFIRGGQTAYDSGNGFYLGYASGYKFSLGNSSGNKLTWDGLSLSLTGSVTCAAGALTVANSTILTDGLSSGAVLELGLYGSGASNYNAVRFWRSTTGISGYMASGGTSANVLTIYGYDQVTLTTSGSNNVTLNTAGLLTCPSLVTAGNATVNGTLTINNDDGILVSGTTGELRLTASGVDGLVENLLGDVIVSGQTYVQCNPGIATSLLAPAIGESVSYSGHQGTTELVMNTPSGSIGDSLRFHWDPVMSRLYAVINGTSGYQIN